MQRIFAFDPGTSAIGWAVLDVGPDKAEIVAAGVRLFALSRHRAVQRMRQRLKPEQRMKLRQRLKLRRKELRAALVSSGLLVSDAQERQWEQDDGSCLRHWLSLSLTAQLPAHALVRILFNAHKQRSEAAYGPDQTPVRDFVESLLMFQAQWHASLRQAECRRTLHEVMFRRRTPQKSTAGARPVSPLAAVAVRQFKVVWRALVHKFGMPQAVRMEVPLPASGKVPVNPQERAHLAERLASIARPPTRQNLLRARIFRQQADQTTDLAVCRISGSQFSFAEAFSPSIEIDHIVPMARNGAGGRHNLALCLADANRAKGASRSAAAATPGHASRRMRDRVDVVDSDALRQSVTLAQEFLNTQGSCMDIRLVSPRRVALARQAWLNKGMHKNRSDLRHHAVDAILIAVVQDQTNNFIPPDAEFLSRIDTVIDGLVVSTKPEQMKSGQLHDDTRYGRPSVQSGFDPQSHVCARKPVVELTRPMLGRLADEGLRKRLTGMDTSRLDDLASIFARTKRVKVVHKANGAIDVPQKEGRPASAVLPFDNHHLDIVQMRDGAWKAYGATRDAISRRGWQPEWERTRVGGKLVMRLHKGDMVEIIHADGRAEIMTVIRLGGAAGTVHLARNFDCSADLVPGDDGEPRPKPRAFAATSLQKCNARAVTVDPTGTVIHRRSNVGKVRTRLLG